MFKHNVLPVLLLLAVSREADADVIVSQKQGFDKCFVPTIAQMQRWWDFSPYWNVNVYIGGSVRACAQTNLTPNWVAKVHQQGWNFIPTWVGPQAPCTGYPDRISWNTGTAFNQGRAEADKAINVATNLGFTSPMIIYYDMEGYPDNTACYNAVNAFFNGWGQRMRERNHRAGGYGSACASGMQAWGDIQNWPHSIWAAHWIYGSFRRSADVWNVACIPNSYWRNHQRIRQYAGDHNEVWGGLTFNIDSNALDGIVQGSNNHAQMRTAPETGPAIDVEDLADPRRNKLVVSDGTGISIDGDRAYVSLDGTRSWREIAKPANGVVQTGQFLDAHRGWIATTSVPDANGHITLYANTTSDGGASWREATVHTFRLDDGNVLAGPVWIDFVDGKTGYIAARLSSSANFSRGLLFQTTDGGATWTQRTMPIGARVRFVDDKTGFVAGGAGGNELHVTRDGGATWTPIEGIDPGEIAFYDLPTFVSDTEGVLPVTVASETKPRVHLYVTRDLGNSWTLAKSVPLSETPGAEAPVAIADASTWIVVDPATHMARFTGPEVAVESAQTASWPQGIVKIHFENAQDGWVETATGTCTGSKLDGTFTCDETRKVLRTTDGGISWRETDAFPTDEADETGEPEAQGGCTATSGPAGTFALILLGLCGLVRRRNARL